MNQLGAFDATIALAEERGMPEQHQFPSLSLEHLRDMRRRVHDDMSGSKLGRWLGWAQCAVVASGHATLDEMKQINLSFRDNAPLSQNEIYNELMGLADSLDEHVTNDEVAHKLRRLADDVWPKK